MAATPISIPSRADLVDEDPTVDGQRRGQDRACGDDEPDLRGIESHRYCVERYRDRQHVPQAVREESGAKGGEELAIDSLSVFVQVCADRESAVGAIITERLE
jgi:hypothetical protein